MTTQLYIYKRMGTFVHDQFSRQPHRGSRWPWCPTDTAEEKCVCELWAVVLMKLTEVLEHSPFYTSALRGSSCLI